MLHPLDSLAVPDHHVGLSTRKDTEIQEESSSLAKAGVSFMSVLTFRELGNADFERCRVDQVVADVLRDLGRFGFSPNIFLYIVHCRCHPPRSSECSEDGAARSCWRHVQGGP